MAFDLALLATKLTRYREQLQLTIDDVARGTGISSADLISYEKAERQPTGDEILILADYFKCDYKFFVSNERFTPFEQTEALYRKFGNEFSKQDRQAIQEFFFLADCEAFLESVLKRPPKSTFSFTPKGINFKVHAKEAAKALRLHLGYPFNQIPSDIYKDFRAIGIRVYRRKLNNSKLSGIFIQHPIAGKCILINYDEDIYRQRFTAAHEAGHSILDAGEPFVVSISKDPSFVEMRANAFASQFLLPEEFLVSIPNARQWDQQKALEWASKLKVSTQALAYALKGHGLIDESTVNMITAVRVQKSNKEDPELPADLPAKTRLRKEALLSRGLSDFYIRLGFEAYRENLISASRLGEMLLMDSINELVDLAQIFGEHLIYDR
jgi:Zn-dependent peptidase ImmA (M78 family)/DNA-binding XRE family transcriptional regulator